MGSRSLPIGIHRLPMGNHILPSGNRTLPMYGRILPMHGRTLPLDSRALPSGSGIPCARDHVCAESDRIRFFGERVLRLGNLAPTSSGCLLISGLLPETRTAGLMSCTRCAELLRTTPHRTGARGWGSTGRTGARGGRVTCQTGALPI